MCLVYVGLVFMTFANVRYKRYHIDTSFEEEIVKGIGKGCNILAIMLNYLVRILAKVILF